MKKLVAACATTLLFSANCYAGGCLPGEPCDDQPKAVAPAMAEAPAPAAAPVALGESECEGWGNRLSAGVPVWFFDKEDTDVGGGLYFDIQNCCLPVNLRVGGEVSHIDLDQANAQASAEFPGKQVEITFVRIPFAVEYVHSFSDTTHLFAGGGPDIITTANDISETSVGLHLSARVLHEFTSHFGLSVEAGYMWGDVDAEGGDVELDTAFVIPALVYTF